MMKAEFVGRVLGLTRDVAKSYLQVYEVHPLSKEAHKITVTRPWKHSIDLKIDR